MWQRFTERARRVVLLGQQEAGKRNSPSVGTEHLLLGLVCVHEGVAAQVLRKMGVSPEQVRQEVEAQVQVQPGQSGNTEPRLTPRAKRTLELAADEARRMRHNYIGTEHLLLALLREKNGRAAMVLRKLELNLEQARRQVMEYLGPELPGAPREATVARTRSSAEFSVTPELQHLLELAQADAIEFGQATFGIGHLIFVLLREKGRLGAHKLLADVQDELEQLLTRVLQQVEEELPPQEVRDLQEELRAVNEAKERAVADEEFERAAVLRDQAREVGQRLADRLKTWMSERGVVESQAQPPESNEKS